MLKFLTLLAIAQPLVVAQSYVGTVASTSTNAIDMYSPTWLSGMFVRTTDNVLILKSYDPLVIVPLKGSCPGGVKGFGANFDGRFVLYGITQNCYMGTIKPNATYTLSLTDDGDIQVINNLKVVQWSLGNSWTKPAYAYEKIYGIKFAPSDTTYTGTNVMTLDGLFGESVDPFYYLHNQVSESAIAMLAPKAANIFTTLTTSGYTFTETQFINALLEVPPWVAGFTSGGVYAANIISFPARFDNSSSSVVNCAIQYVVKSGRLFVAAAGNNNTNIAFRNPYAFTVGAVDYNYLTAVATTKATPATFSNYGAAVDIWGPKHLQSDKYVGSSMSTAIMAGVFASAIEKYPTQLSGKPGVAYNYIKQLARIDFVLGTDPKVTASPNAGTRFPDLRRLATVVPGTVSSIPTGLDYCGALKLPAEPGLNLATALASLKPFASTTNVGRLVGLPGGSMGTSLFTK